MLLTHSLNESPKSPRITPSSLHLEMLSRSLIFQLVQKTHQAKKCNKNLIKLTELKTAKPDFLTKFPTAFLTEIATFHRPSTLNLRPRFPLTASKWHLLTVGFLTSSSALCNKLLNSITNFPHHKTIKHLSSLHCSALSLYMRKIPLKKPEEEEKGDSIMSISLYEAYKKRKRTPQLYGFHTFGDPGCPVFLSAPFRDNIRLFIRECGEIEDYNVQGMPIWCTLLLNEKNGVVVPLYTIEENVNHSSDPFCDQCRSVGWSHHFMSKRKYHFIIPVDDKWNKPLQSSVFNLNNHILHGLIHCNGFGHLLCINGHEGGSKYLHGTEVMDLWDRICNALRTRKITVEDTSRKRSTDLRLLYSVAYGYPWFGRWGYKFCHGSFGVNEYKYEAAIGILSSLHLDQVVQDLDNTESDGRYIKQMVQIYRQVSDTQLITVRDLLRFMFSLKAMDPVERKSLMPAAPIAPPKPVVKVIRQRRSPVKEIPAKFSTFATAMASRWPSRRLEYAAEVIVDALKEKRGGMTRQEVRDAARLCIGDTGLLDFVIKSINNYIVGNYVVRRTVNSTTKILQFRVHEVGSAEPDTNTITEPSLGITDTEEVGDPPGVDVNRDIEYLYQQVFEDYRTSQLVELATRVLFDSRHFAKDWPFRDEEDDLLRFMCHILPTSEELQIESSRPLPPGELVILPPYVTIGDLKAAAESAFRDTYCVLESYIVTEVEGMNMVDDEEVLFGTMESGIHIWVRGTGIDMESKLKYEGGVDNWTVDCSCGAKDDDGERMVACDICEVWQHTRCGGIEDSESVPPLFLCGRCSSSLLPEALGEYDLGMEFQ